MTVYYARPQQSDRSRHDVNKVNEYVALNLDKFKPGDIVISDFDAPDPDILYELEGSPREKSTLVTLISFPVFVSRFTYKFKTIERQDWAFIDFEYTALVKEV